MNTRSVSRVIALAAGTAMSISAASAQIIFSNCNLATGATSLNGTAAPAGQVWSECARDATDATTANTTAGFGGSGAFRLADDFVVPAGGATISAIRIYAYTNGTLSPAISAATLQILDSTPAGAPTVLFGDQTTNRVLAGSNVMTNIVRVFNTITPPACGGALTPPTTGRVLQQVDIAVNPPLSLSAGTYWIDYGFTGVLFAPPATIATAIGRQCNPANANGLQFNAGWGPANDLGQGCAAVASQQDMFFNVIGSLGGGGPTGACCLTSGASNCIVVSATFCASQGGTYAGDNVTCAAANCPPLPTGACCAANGSCTTVTQVACAASGGVYSGNTVTCAAANCLPTGWVEVGDAGDAPGTAQSVVAASAANLQSITGNIAAGDADVYKFRICNEGSFGATLVGGATFDTQLALFSSTGLGVAFNDDTAVLQSALTSTFVLANGDYYLGVSAYDNDPVDAGALALWLDTPFGIERAPDGPGAANAWADYDNTGTTTGAYVVAMTGSCFIPNAPACYADCDGVGGLTANDFICFLTKYNQGDSYADCDTVGGLTANDFICFLTKYNQGCS